jgi:hypothetical protein
MAQKSSDTSAIPLCSRHHRTGRDSYHKLGPRTFVRHHGLNIRFAVARLNSKPSIRIESGSFMARLGDDNYVLGPVRIGLEAAVRKALSLKTEDRTWCSRDEAAPSSMHEFFRVRERFEIEPG